MTARRKKRPRTKRKPAEADGITRAELRAAEREAARSKALIDAGETFAGHKANDWRLGGARREPRR